MNIKYINIDQIYNCQKISFYSFEIIFHVIMKMKAIITYSSAILILFCLFGYLNAQSCDLMSNQVNIQILDKQTIPCLQKALKNGWSNVIDHLVKQKQSQYQNEFVEVFTREVKRLQMLEEQIVLGKSQTQPILKWGQNRTHIFITFKLSHRWDSPPCLFTQSQKSQLSTQNLFYNNICLVSHQKISFIVNLNLFRNVFHSLQDNNQLNQTSNIETNYTDYSFEIKKDGVGTYSTVLLKQAPQIWLFLTRQQKMYPLWHQIQTRYPDQYKQYSQNVQAYKISKKQQKTASQSFLTQTRLVVLSIALMALLIFY